MSIETWQSVDRFLEQSVLGDDDDFGWILEANENAGLPAIDVTPLQGKLLELLCETCGASRILEIGTLGGYSTAWMARSLPFDGQLVSLELETTHANLAKSNLARAVPDKAVEIIVGPALDSLARMREQNVPAFDFVFVDADKPGNPEYFRHILNLTRPGSLIVFDNVVREGEVVDETSDDPSVIGIRQLCQQVASCPTVKASAIQTVGHKGYDGMLIARVIPG